MCLRFHTNIHEFIYIHCEYILITCVTPTNSTWTHTHTHTHTRTNLRAHTHRKLGYPVFCPFQIRNGGVFNLPATRLDDILFREAQKQTKENVKRRLHNEARAERLRGQAHLCTGLGESGLCADSLAPPEDGGGPSTAAAAELKSVHRRRLRHILASSSCCECSHSSETLERADR
jgi:hypothetical protein